MKFINRYFTQEIDSSLIFNFAESSSAHVDKENPDCEENPAIAQENSAMDPEVSTAEDQQEEQHSEAKEHSETEAQSSSQDPPSPVQRSPPRPSRQKSTASLSPKENMIHNAIRDLQKRVEYTGSKELSSDDYQRCRQVKFILEKAAETRILDSKINMLALASAPSQASRHPLTQLNPFRHYLKLETPCGPHSPCRLDLA